MAAHIPTGAFEHQAALDKHVREIAERRKQFQEGVEQGRADQDSAPQAVGGGNGEGAWSVPCVTSSGVIEGPELHATSEESNDHADFDSRAESGAQNALREQNLFAINAEAARQEAFRRAQQGKARFDSAQQALYRLHITSIPPPPPPPPPPPTSDSSQPCAAPWTQEELERESPLKLLEKRGLPGRSPPLPPDTVFQSDAASRRLTGSDTRIPLYLRLAIHTPLPDSRSPSVSSVTSSRRRRSQAPITSGQSISSASGASLQSAGYYGRRSIRSFTGREEIQPLMLRSVIIGRAMVRAVTDAERSREASIEGEQRTRDVASIGRALTRVRAGLQAGPPMDSQVTLPEHEKGDTGIGYSDSSPIGGFLPEIRLPSLIDPTIRPAPPDSDERSVVRDVEAAYPLLHARPAALASADNDVTPGVAPHQEGPKNYRKHLHLGLWAMAWLSLFVTLVVLLGVEDKKLLKDTHGDSLTRVDAARDATTSATVVNKRAIEADWKKFEYNATCEYVLTWPEDLVNRLIANTHVSASSKPSPGTTIVYDSISESIEQSVKSGTFDKVISPVISCQRPGAARVAAPEHNTWGVDLKAFQRSGLSNIITNLQLTVKHSIDLNAHCPSLLPSQRQLQPPIPRCNASQHLTATLLQFFLLCTLFVPIQQLRDFLMHKLPSRTTDSKERRYIVQGLVAVVALAATAGSGLGVVMLVWTTVESLYE